MDLAHKALKAMRKKREDSVSFDSQAQAASALGIDISDVRRAKRGGCPAFRSGRVYPKPLVAWLRQHPAVKLNEPSKAHWDCENARLQYERKAYQLELERQKYVPLDEISAATGKTILAFRAAVNTLPESVAQQLSAGGPGKDFHAIKDILQSEVDAILRTLNRSNYLKEGFTQAIVEAGFSDCDEKTKTALAHCIDVIFREMGRRTLSDLLQRDLPTS